MMISKSYFRFIPADAGNTWPVPVFFRRYSVYPR
ncbi:hypothetical protein ECYG_01996 [Escherichia coli B367]|nr:hypothetical protein ECYG_01996 [Escherichia coli B367]